MIVLAAQWLAIEGVPCSSASDEQSFAAQGTSPSFTVTSSLCWY